MLKAIPRNSSFFQATLVGGFLLLIFIPSYIDKNNDPRDPTRYVLNTHSFLIALCIISALSAMLYFYFRSATKTFTIFNDRVELKFYLKPKQQFLLSDINEIEWSSGIRSVGTRVSGRGEIARGDSITIILKNGDVLYFDVSEYKNFDELRGWFLTYARNSGIIKVEPINNRGRG